MNVSKNLYSLIQEPLLSFFSATSRGGSASLLSGSVAFFFFFWHGSLCLCKIMLSFFFILGGKSPMKMSSLILVYTLRKRKVVFSSLKHDLWGFLRLQEQPNLGSNKRENCPDKTWFQYCLYQEHTNQLHQYVVYCIVM